MINFTVGPVQSSEAVRDLGAEQVPYFRTAEFSEIMLANEQLIKKFAHATDDSRVVFLTCSGSGGMEAAIMNTLSKGDKALVINGGSFGERFVELLTLHEIPFTEIKMEKGKALKPEHLAPYEGKGYTAFLFQKHETSTGVHYDAKLISDFCKRNSCFMIVDTISTFLADSFDMSDLNAGVMITGSQKALACPPGIAVMVLAPSALERIKKTKCCCQYLDLKLALKNQERGQTPWTPAVGVLRQINVRLKEIEAKLFVINRILSRGNKSSSVMEESSLNAPYLILALTIMSFIISSYSSSDKLTDSNTSTVSWLMYLSKPILNSNSLPHLIQNFEISGDSAPQFGQIFIFSPLILFN